MNDGDFYNAFIDKQGGVFYFDELDAPLVLVNNNDLEKSKDDKYKKNELYFIDLKTGKSVVMWRNPRTGEIVLR